jgi:protein phosphatase
VKILIISDVHGNAEALAALDKSYDELWVLGDLVDYGPDPKAVIATVRANAAIVVRGNHDHAVGYDVDPQCAPPFRAMAEATQRYTMATLHEADREYLRQLPVRQTITRDGRRVYLCHATPSEPLFAYCPPESPRWAQEVARVDADVMLVGHTHLPFIISVGGREVVNPGSLGQPKHGGPNASYAVWHDGHISLHTIPYAVERTVSRLQQLPLPNDITASLTHLLQTGKPPAE